MNDDIILDEVEPKIRRRALLPWWMKGFIWLIFLFTAVIPIAVYNAVVGNNFDLSIYGLESSKLVSGMSVVIIALYLLKAVAAFSLWTEQDRAISIAIADGIVGIVASLFTMFLLPTLGPYQFSFRIELLLSIIYLKHILEIKTVWMKNK